MSTWIRLVSIGLTLVATGSALARAGAPDQSKNAEPYRPDPASVQRFGPGYRYPQAGWIVLHIEGSPTNAATSTAGLMAPEIARFVGEMARYRSSQGARRRLARLAAARRRPLLAAIRSRISRGDEGNRRRRGRGRRPSGTGGRSICSTS